MSNRCGIGNRIRQYRGERNWSQQELARLAGISRAAVSAIEQQRLTPSVVVALALARVFGCSVEELFAEPAEVVAPAWFSEPRVGRYWLANVGGQIWRYPVEATEVGVLPHDGVYNGRSFQPVATVDCDKSLVVATCDPAIGLLVGEYARQTPFRLIPIVRSSRAALELVRDRKVHAAGLHLASSREGNSNVVSRWLGGGYRLLRGAAWDEGVVLAPRLKLKTEGAVVKASLKWVGRQPGSGAQQCLAQLLGEQRLPRRIATDHRGIARAIRGGWADAGIGLQLVAEEAGLGFLKLRKEAYDLCYPQEFEQDPRLISLRNVVRSQRYRQLLDGLPGYDPRTTGGLVSC